MSEEINNNLNTEIEDLKKMLEDANADISSLSTELEHGKRKISELEKSLIEANSTISAKDEEFDKLRTYQEKFETSVEESNKLKANFDDLKIKMSIVEEENAKLTSQLAELNNLLLQKDSEIEELNETISKKDKFIEEQTAHLEELKAKLFMLKPPEILTRDITTEVRVKCVNCGAVGKDIKVVEDKSRVLSYVGNIPMYAKKHVCKKCGFEF